MQSKNIFSTWLPCIQHWFSSLNSMQPFGQGWAFLPFNKPLAYFRAKMPTPALRAAYCFMRKTSSSCRATNYIQFFSLLQSFFSVYTHHISVILLNKRTLIISPISQPPRSVFFFCQKCFQPLFFNCKQTQNQRIQPIRGHLSL